MLGLSVYGFARAVRELPWGQEIRLIEDRERTKEAGFDLHLVKPVGRATLLKAIAQVQAQG